MPDVTGEYRRFFDLTRVEVTFTDDFHQIFINYAHNKYTELRCNYMLQKARVYHLRIRQSSFFFKLDF